MQNRFPNRSRHSAGNRFGIMEVAIHNLSHVYGTRGRLLPVLHDVSFQVRNREFAVIVGPSGCGKSTLVNLVGGFLSPTQGEVRVGGNVVMGPGADRVVMFQRSALFPFYNVEQNVEYGLKLRNIPRLERLGRVETALASVGLDAFRHCFPKELSEGMRKLAEIARALVLDPPVLLFDESLGDLDALTRQRMQSFIQEIWMKKPVTTIWITHDLEEAALLADRVIVLSPRPGQVRAVREVPLARPRDESTRTSPRLQEIRSDLFDLFSNYDAQLQPSVRRLS